MCALPRVCSSMCALPMKLNVSTTFVLFTHCIVMRIVIVFFMCIVRLVLHLDNGFVESVGVFRLTTHCY